MAHSQLAINRARDVPTIALFPVNTRVFNFVFKGPVDTFSFSPRDLCAMVGVAHPGAGTTDVFPAFQSVRLDKVEMWGGTNPSPGTPLPGVQAWVARTLTDGAPVRPLGSVRQDLQVPSSDIPAHCVLSSAQRANSILRQWFEQDDQAYLFTMTGGTGSIVQITVSYTLSLFPPNISNSIPTNSYLDITGRPALGLSALDSGNATGFRVVVPAQITNSTSSVIPIFD